MKIITFIIVAISFFPVHGVSQDKKDFKVFNALLFKNTPDLSEYGFSDINVIYEDGVITTNSSFKRGEFDWRYIDEAKVISESNKSKVNKNIPVVLDVEYWGGRLYRSSTRKKAEDIFVELIEKYRSNDSTSMVSVFHYGILSKRILDESNVVFPCFYTHSDDRKEWLNMVKYNLNNLKKINSKNLPVYVFIWPQYNPVPERHDLGYRFIDKEFWRFQLDSLYELCDGVVIWSHHRDSEGKTVFFDEKMEWFQETLDFINKNSINNINSF